MILTSTVWDSVASEKGEGGGVLSMACAQTHTLRLAARPAAFNDDAVGENLGNAS
jgi:hypothetical protein